MEPDKTKTIPELMAEARKKHLTHTLLEACRQVCMRHKLDDEVYKEWRHALDYPELHKSDLPPCPDKGDK